MPNKKSTYRPEIDGLRAIAVLGVLLFHAEFGFSGGFTGVDVFFVISGFLISGNIDRGLVAGKFSMAEFWFRRIRRILPSSLAVGGTTLVVGYFLMLPGDFADLSKSLLAQLCMVSNFYFAEAGDYFGAKSDAWPLLHTWSLSVEEQFYIFFPVFYWLVSGAKRRSMLLVGCILSFSASVIAIPYFPREAFYLLPTRAWQLLAGALVYEFFQNRKLSPTVSQISTWTGLLSIGLPMVLMSKSTPFPGLSALPSTLGAALMLIGMRDDQGIICRVLSSKWPVRCGMVSYSLYLWHWPPLAFATYFYPSGVPVLVKCLAIAFGIALTMIGYFLVEKPCRLRGPIVRMRPTLVATSAVVVTLIVFSSATILNHGFVGRFEQINDVINAGEMLPTQYQTKHASELEVSNIPRVGVIDSDIRPSFLVWGDSHTYPLIATIDNAAKTNGVCGLIGARNATVPLKGIWRPNYRGNSREALRWNSKLLSLVLEHRINRVFLICRWDVAVFGRPSGELDTLVALENETTATTESAWNVFRQGLEKSIAELQNHNVDVVLIAQPPTLACHPNRVAAVQYMVFGKRLDNVSMPAFEFDEQARILETMQSLTGPNVTLIEPQLDSNLARDKNNKLEMTCFTENQPIYVDTNHLTPFGATRLYGRQIQQAMASVVEGVKEVTKVHHK